MRRHHHETISTTLSTLPFLTAVASLALVEIGHRVGQVIRLSNHERRDGPHEPK